MDFLQIFSWQTRKELAKLVRSQFSILLFDPAGSRHRGTLDYKAFLSLYLLLALKLPFNLILNQLIKLLAGDITISAVILYLI